MARIERDPEFYQLWRKKPRRGTATRLALIQMLKPGGTTAPELMARGVLRPGATLTNVVESLENNYGWIIRRENAPPERIAASAGGKDPSKRRVVVYKAVGKLKGGGLAQDYSRWSVEED